MRLDRSVGRNEVPVKEASEVRPNALECARVGHTLVTIDHLVEDSVTGNYLKELVGRDGIEPPTPGFSVLCSTN